MTAYDDLDARLRAFNAAPFLFVGAGMSRRYLGTDGWVDLLTRMAAYTGRPYGYFASKADGLLPRVASEIAEAFHETWWSHEQFENSRTQFGEGLATLQGPLKVEVSRYVEAAIQNVPKDGQGAKEMRLLRDAVIDGAITTNYDGLLEYLFPEFATYIGQDELLFSDSQGIGEIYHVHGSAEKPESLVISEEDYDEFNERNPYLAAKLLTIFVEHPVIFLGYSLQDKDVTEILVSVARVLTTENLGRLRDRLIFVEWDEHETPTLSVTQIAVSNFTIPVILMKVPDFEGIFQILSKLERKISARLLRQLKERVYELVYSSSPTEKIAVIDVDDATNIEDVEFVIGVGIQERLGQRGYVGLTREELLLDLLKRDSSYDARKVVSEAIPRLMQRPGNIPIYRYLRQSGKLDDTGLLTKDALVSRRLAQRVAQGASAFGLTQSTRRKAERIATEVNGQFGALREGYSVQDVLMSVAALPRDGVDLNEFRDYLVEHQHLFNSGQSTAWAKAVCLYDYHRFGLLDSGL